MRVCVYIYACVCTCVFVFRALRLNGKRLCAELHMIHKAEPFFTNPKMFCSLTNYDILRWPNTSALQANAAWKRMEGSMYDEIKLLEDVVSCPADGLSVTNVKSCLDCKQLNNLSDTFRLLSACKPGAVCSDNPIQTLTLSTMNT